MMTTKRLTARQRELDRIIATIGRFALSETCTDEQQAQEHLASAIEELRTASKMLIEESQS